MIGAARALLMFSVATLLLASPVYLRLLESPGLGGLARLIGLLQIAPTIVLSVVDMLLERRSRSVWRGWRAALSALCVLSVARQVQVSFNLPVHPSWSTLIVAGGVLALCILVVYRVSMSERFLVAFAPGLLVWTLGVGYTFLPVAERTVLQAPPSRSSAVFVLLFDELDRDMVMPDGRVRTELPNFRRLAAGSLSFVDATANYGRTCASVGSLLTGELLERMLPVDRNCLRDATHFREDNLLTEVARRLTVRLYGQYLAYCFDAAFQCRGTTYVQVRAPHLTLLQHYVPDGLRLATGAHRILGFSQQTYALPIFDEFLRGVRASEARGAFHWVHVLLPHAPYVLDEHGVVHRPDYGEYWWDAGEYRRALAAYRRQVGFVDRLLGRFLDKLEVEGLAADAVVIVTSDHGFYSLQSMAPPRVIDGFEVNAARPRVPLIIRAPGITPGVVTADYQHVDFRQLVLRLIDGRGVAAPIQSTRGKVFCDGVTWYVRGADRRWRPQRDPDDRPRVCRDGSIPAP